MGSVAQRRVVITGLGLVSPLANRPQALYDALIASKSGVRLLDEVLSDYLPTLCAASAREFTGHIDDFGPLAKEHKKSIRKGLKVMCREIQMGVASAQLALLDAGMEPGGYDPDRAGVVFGSDYMMTRPEEFCDAIAGCLDEEGKFDYGRWSDQGMPHVAPLWLLKYLPNMPASHIAIYNELRGPSNSITHREASSNLSIAEAYTTVVRGAADVMIAGATGTRVHPMRAIHMVTEEQVASNGHVPAQASRPFDQNRSGQVLGEGSGAVMLELLSSAQARQATIYGEVVGYGSSAVLQRNSIARRDRALVNAARMALSSASMSAEQIGHVHAHGLSTRSSDIEESRAIQEVFGDRSRPVPVVAAKGNFGNLGAGGGAVELIASLLALRHGRLFPVLNYETPDPDCPVSVVRAGEDVDAGSSVLNLNVTPQGQAAALVVRKVA